MLNIVLKKLIQQFYEQHKEHFILSESIMKGLLLIVPIDAPNLNSLRKDVKELKLIFTPEQYSFVLAELRKYGDDFTHSLLQILNIIE